MPRPKYLEMDDNQIRLERSKRQEVRGARNYKGRRIRGSGSGVMKGDMDSKYFRIEAKRTDKRQKSITIKQEYLDKIRDQAFEDRKLPALEIEIGNAKPWVIIRKEEFQNMISYFAQHGEG